MPGMAARRLRESGQPGQPIGTTENREARRVNCHPYVILIIRSDSIDSVEEKGRRSVCCAIFCEWG